MQRSKLKNGEVAYNQCCQSQSQNGSKKGYIEDQIKIIKLSSAEFCLEGFEFFLLYFDDILLCFVDGLDSP